MKRVMFSLVAAVAALILGCQTPDASNPVATGDNALQASIAKPAPIPAPNSISFDQLVTYKGFRPIPESYRAIGNVNFRIARIPTLPVTDIELYDVVIAVTGELSKVVSTDPAFRTAPWTFGGKSKVRIRIPQGGKSTFEVKFQVRGARVPSVVIMPFAMTENNLTLQNLSLVRVKADEFPAAATE
jgi:hypothetical protein